MKQRVPVRQRRLHSAVALMLAALSGAGDAIAAPLAKDACDGLKAEQEALGPTGIKEDLAKGAAWGRANLKTDRLAQVARFIDLEEQLLFRCGLGRARYVAPRELDAAAEPEQAPVKPKPKSKIKTAAPATTSDAPAPSANTKVKAKPAASAAATQIAPAKTVQAKPQPRVDDAYKPPGPAPKQ